MQVVSIFGLYAVGSKNDSSFSKLFTEVRICHTPDTDLEITSIVRCHSIQSPTTATDTAAPITGASQTHNLSSSNSSVDIIHWTASSTQVVSSTQVLRAGDDLSSSNSSVDSIHWTASATQVVSSTQFLRAGDENIHRKHMFPLSCAFQTLLTGVINRALRYQRIYNAFTSLYRSVLNKIHSGPGYRKRKCSKMKKIYNYFDTELRLIHVLSEQYKIQVSPLKTQTLLHRLNILNIEFEERFSELCTLRIQSKRFCHKCPKEFQFKKESVENYCFSKSHVVLTSSCCYSPPYACIAFDEKLKFSKSSQNRLCAIPCVISNSCILSSCVERKFEIIDSNSFVHPQLKFFSKKVICGKWKKRFLSRECKKIRVYIVRDPCVSKTLHFLVLISFLLHIVNQNLIVNPQYFSKYEYDIWLEFQYRDFDTSQILSHSWKKSRKRRNKEMHIMHGNTDRIQNQNMAYSYPYLHHRATNSIRKDLVETQDPSRLDCLKHALNNMFHTKNYFTRNDLEITVSEILNDFELVSPNSNEYTRLKLEHVSRRGNYSVNVGHKLLSKRGFDILNLKYFENQHGVDYTVFLPSFRGDVNFVGCLLQRGSANFGHYTCIHHDQNTGKLFYMDSCTSSIEIRTEHELQVILGDQKVWSIFTKHNIEFEYAWIDTWCRYVQENKNDDIYQKMLIQYYFTENKEILQVQMIKIMSI